MNVKVLQPTRTKARLSAWVLVGKANLNDLSESEGHNFRDWKLPASLKDDIVVDVYYLCCLAIHEDVVQVSIT